MKDGIIKNGMKINHMERLSEINLTQKKIIDSLFSCVLSVKK